MRWPAVFVAVVAGGFSVGNARQRRVLQSDSCSDDDATFAASYNAVQLGVSSCAAATALFGVDGFCSEPFLQAAISEGCRQTCGLCGSSSGAGAGTTSTEPVTTTAAGTNEAPSAALASNVSLITQPVAEGEEEPEADMSTGIFITIVGLFVVAVFLTGVVLLVWYCSTLEKPRKRSKVHPEAEARVEELFDGSYRTKKVGGEDEAEVAPQPRKRRFVPERPLDRLMGALKYCCRQRVRRAALPSQGLGQPGDVAVGNVVRLTKLSQGQYNGLHGTVVDGPDERQRFWVDVTILDDGNCREVKTMSFRPDNLRPLLVVEFVQCEAEYEPENAPARGHASSSGGSYRSGRTGGSYRG